MGEPDVIEKFSHLPLEWIAWEPDIIESFSHLPLDWIAWEPDIIEKFSQSPCTLWFQLEDMFELKVTLQDI